MKQFQDLNLYVILFLIIILSIIHYCYCTEHDTDEYCSRKKIIKSVISGIIRGFLMGLIILNAEFAMVSALVLGIINPIVTLIEHHI